MAHKAFVAGQTKKVSHPEDRTNPTIYVIQSTPHWVRSMAQDESFSMDGVKAGKALSMTIQYGLLDIENLLGEDGEPVKIEHTELKQGSMKHMCVAPGTLNLLPPEVETWLAGEIRKFSTLTPEEAKN